MKLLVSYLLLMLAVPTTPAYPATAESRGKGFPTATAAAQALVDAARADNTAELISILGPSAKDIISSRDSVQDRKMRRAFVSRTAQKMTVVPVRGHTNEMTLIAGNDSWPLPIPIVQADGKWYFDMVRGRKRILMRRIGSNELDAIEVCRGYVEAQNQYAEQHQTPQGVRYYAQKILSSPGEHDGLYWEGAGQEQSPIGALVARAVAEGYKKGEPYHGYFFRILTGEGSDASEPMSYIDGGVMSKGFALVAWPAQYGSTGVMTFLVNRTGIVYQKNLGPATSRAVAQLTRYAPNKTWMPASAGALVLARR